jgi:hypothetical protein
MGEGGEVLRSQTGLIRARWIFRNPVLGIPAGRGSSGPISATGRSARRGLAPITAVPADDMAKSGS